MLDFFADAAACGGVVAMGPDGAVRAIGAGRSCWPAAASAGCTKTRPTTPHHRRCHCHGAAPWCGLRHLDYIQIHPTTLFSRKKGRRFLISESVRGEGALLLDKNGNRFTNELQPRDVVSAAIRAQMEKDGTEHVWEDMRPIGEAVIREHFPNILERCEEEGYDPLHEPIPVLPAQHYFMGGIQADLSSRTALPRLYACGETCCNGVHGRNRLASNSLLESLVFAQRAADDILFGSRPPLRAMRPTLPLPGDRAAVCGLPNRSFECDREEQKS